MNVLTRKTLAAFIALSIVLVLTVSTGIAFAEYYNGEEDPALFVTNKDGAKVWMSTSDDDSNFVFEVIPYGACIFNWYPHSDEYVAYDYVGDSGFISWDDLSRYPNGENEYPPLYVVGCDEWISVWEEPQIGSGRLTKLTLGAEINAWMPYDKNFIWYEQDDVYGFVAWEYLSYNLPEGLQ